MRSLVALLAALAFACGKHERPAATEAGRARTGLSLAPAQTARESRGAAAAPLPTAAGGEVTSAATVTDCPRALAGAESVNRVLTKACGVVDVTEDYHINNGSLTLEAGATLAFHDGVALNIGFNDSARLIVRGTEDDPVVFTAAGDKTPGAWRGVRLFSHADRSTIDRLVVEYAGAGAEEAVRIDGQDIVWTRSTVRSAGGVGIAVGRHGTLESFSGNIFENVRGRWPLSLGPSAASGIDGESRFPPGSLIRVYGGTILGQVVWRPAGAPYFVSDDVHVEGEPNAPGSLTIGAGVEVRFAPEARLAAGYSVPGALRVAGVPFAPVLLTASRERWPGVFVDTFGEATFTSTVFEHAGDPEGENAAALRVEGTVTVTGCTFRGNSAGVALRPRARVRAFDGNAFSGNAKGAILLFPRQFEALGVNNRYADGERIELDGGSVEETAMWATQATVVDVLGDLHIDGRTVLTIQAGARFALRDKVELSVGWRDNATLRLLGAPDRPIELAGQRDDVGSWGGLRLDANSRDSVLEHVRLRNAAAGVTVASEANARVVDLSCARCAGPALTVACNAKVAAEDVSAAAAQSGVRQEECPP